MAVSAVISYCCSTRGQAPDSGFAEYVEAYTGGIVTGDDDIVIELASPAEGLQGTTEELDKAAARLFKFSPSLEGTARWTSPQRIEFTPSEGALKPGRNYTCTFSLGDVAATDRKHKHFTFSFVSARKEATLEYGSIDISRDDPGKARVIGTLTLSESIDTDDPSGMVDFGWGGDGAVFEVRPLDSRRFEFTASGLERSTKDKVLTIRFKPGNTGFSECDALNLDIPATGNFRVLDARMSDGDDRFMDVTFSEPLDREQDLKGLVSITTSDEYNDSESIGLTTLVKDNHLRIYYDTTDDGDCTLEIDGAIRDISGKKLGDKWIKTFTTGAPLPDVSFPVSGSILPQTDNLTVPFKAVNLNAVDISVIKIYTSNVLMFLQENDLHGDSGLRRAGRLVYKSTMRLDSDPSTDLTKMHTYTIGLDKLFKKEHGAIYRMRLSFKPEYYIYYKGDKQNRTGSLINTSAEALTDEESMVWDEPSPYYYDSGRYDWSKYRWRDRKNPLTPSFYMDYDFPARNFMTSSLGAIAKYSGGKSVWVGVSDILSAEPVHGAEIRIYNYQLQIIGKGKSHGDGMTEIEISGKPFIAVIRKGESTTYLKITDGTEKSLSRFDTGGEILQKGMKGFIYGERGVWRPGDTLHLTMILHGEDRIPDTHPASMDIYTPQGQFFARKVCRKAENGFYAFDVPVGQDSPTGLWNAYVKVGGATFHKSLRIETIKPNRLKVNVDMGSRILRSGAKANVSVSSSWLTGPAASGLQAKVTMTLKAGKPDFKGYEGYTFTDPASDFESSTAELMSRRLDTDGKASASVTLPKSAQAPGMLSANILGTVTEDGGDESYTALTLPFSPFSAYAGIWLPAGDSYLETGKTHLIPVVALDADGRKVNGHRLEWRIFKLKWSWWWESRKEPLDSYVNASAASAVSSGVITSGSGNMNIRFNVNDNDWGRYLIYVKDLDSGHATGGIVYADWAAYRGRSDRSDPDAPAMLSFSLDKKKYTAGETAIVYIPAADKGLALVSIEKGGKVLAGEWVKTSATEDTPYKIKITGDMAPDFYVHITLVQPYMSSSNDLPLRMYGVQPVMVEAPASHLEPVISMPDKLHPEEPFTVKVSEKSGKPMTYTLAIVDDGLLDLTAFRTPDPWNFFYRREALGVRTWDMYDDVFGSTGGALAAMFSIGGDEGLIKGARKENRFNPVVKVLGPFTLKSGMASHRITLPMYVGSVRTMVMAGNGSAFGNASRTTPVTSPVMILPTLPRFASCGERITLPVNVIVMEDGIGKVNVSVHCEGPISIEGPATSTVTTGGRADKMARFALKAAHSVTGDGSMARITVTAEGGGHKMTESISLEVRNPSPRITSISGILLGKNESRTLKYKPFTAETGQSAWIEASGYPSIGWDALFSEMSSYPHSCTEQLSAKGLSLIYSMDMLSKDNAAKAREMIPAILSGLYSRQLPDGGFAYWPGETHSDEWVTSMAGEFMTAAKSAGFDVSSGVTGSWLKFQKRCVQNYRTAKVYELSDLTQAYRLYTLALARNADEASMNRMKEGGNLSWQASMMLSSAYSLCGKKAVGEAIIKALADSPNEWTSNMQTYGSPLRDKALALEAMIRSGNIQGAAVYAASLAREDSGIHPWPMSTQESAAVARAMSLLARNVTIGAVSVNVNERGKDARNVSGNGMAKAMLNPANGEVTIKNSSSGPVYVSLTTVSQAAPGEAVIAKESRIGLNIRYVGPDGSAIFPSSIRQGTEFTAVIRVTNPSPSEDLYNMALTEMIPSGWEIINERLTGQDIPSAGRYDYKDIRDDRNVFYFSLPRGTFKEFKVRLRAAYEGTFVLPSVTCEAMYDANVFACTASGNALVTR